MVISITEFRKHLGQYLKLVITEEIRITKRGKVVAILHDPHSFAIEKLLSLAGCLKDIDDGRPYDEIIGDLIAEKQGFN